MRRIILTFITVITVMVASVANAASGDYIADDVTLMLQLTTRTPVDRIAWLKMDEDKWLACNMRDYATSCIYRAKTDKLTVAMSTSKATIERVISEVRWADAHCTDGYRYAYARVEPAVVIGFYEKGHKSAEMYRVMFELSNNKWKDKLHELLEEKNASDKELEFHMHAIYMVSYMKCSSKNEIHKMLDYLDGETSTVDYLKSQFGLKNPLEESRDDYWRHNPLAAPREFNYEKEERQFRQYYSEIREYLDRWDFNIQYY